MSELSYGVVPLNLHWEHAAPMGFLRFLAAPAGWDPWRLAERLANSKILRLPENVGIPLDFLVLIPANEKAPAQLKVTPDCQVAKVNATSYDKLEIL